MATKRIELEIEQSVWEAAQPIIAQTTLTPSTFFQGVLRRVVNEGCIHMDHFSPSAATLEAMYDRSSGAMRSFNSVKELMDSLHDEED